MAGENAFFPSGKSRQNVGKCGKMCGNGFLRFPVIRQALPKDSDAVRIQTVDMRGGEFLAQ
jgi:hypothetical protein